MPKKKSLGSNPLASRSSDAKLRAVLRGGAEKPARTRTRLKAAKRRPPASKRRAARPRPTPTPAPTTPIRSGRSAVVLSGGGAYGAFEVGVLKALAAGASPAVADRPLELDILTGTSVGSFNAAVLAAHAGDGAPAAVARLEHLWLERVAGRNGDGNGVYRFRANPLDYMSPGRLARHPLQPWSHMMEDGAFFARDWLERGVNFLRSSGSLAHRTLELADLGAMITTAPFRQLVEEVVDLDRIRSSEVALRISTTNWETGKLRVFSNPDLDDRNGHDAILASSSLPGFFPAVTIDDEPYVDGGIVMNTPLTPAIDSGAETLHVVYLDPDVGQIPRHRLRNTLDTFDRLLAILFASQMNEEITNARWINRGLGVLERAARNRGAPPDGLEAFVRVAARIEKRLRDQRPFRKLTIHRYHPTEDLGGAIGFLDFRHDHLEELVARGHAEAAGHDCDVAGCVLPD